MRSKAQPMKLPFSAPLAPRPAALSASEEEAQYREVEIIGFKESSARHKGEAG